MKLVCISDTHTRHHWIDEVPEGDVLIHAGDMTNRGSFEDLEFFLHWFAALPHPNKILISGNHDWCFERQSDASRKIVEDHGVIYLNDEGITIDGVKFWGSPVQPEFCNWAFNRRRGSEINEHWRKIPKNTDVLITHGPPYGILDETYMTRGPVGCGDLRDHILQRVKPKVHIFGHIHEAHGVEVVDGITFINASQLNDYYSKEADFNPVVFELDAKKKKRRRRSKLPE